MNQKNNLKEQNNKNQPKEVKLSRVFFYYWKFARKYKWWFVTVTFLFSVGNGLFTVGTPYFSKILINDLNNHKEWTEIQLIFLGIILLFVLSSLFLRLATHLAIKYEVRALNDLIKYTFRQVTRRQLSFFEDAFVGTLISRMEKFAVAFTVLREGIFETLFTVVVKIIVSVVIIFFVDTRIGLMFAGWFVIYVLTTVLILRKKMKLDDTKTRLVSKRIGVAADIITNILNMKIFASRQRELNYYAIITEKSKNAVLRSWNWGNFQDVVSAILFAVLEFLALGLALRLWHQGKLTVGDIVMIQSYFALFLTSLWSISGLFKRLLQAISDAKEMVEIFDKEVKIKDVRNAKKLKVVKGEIVFQDTTFSYPNQKENVFNRFNLKIPAGQRVGLVGTSGAGKTTITKLLLRFIDLDKGKILIDGQDIAKVTQNSLRKSISYVPQEPVLFHRSIYENIAYANPKAKKEEVIKVSKKAYVDEFVQTLEKGYDTLVGERGVKLSGGQKQRVAIARAFLKNAPILVLDEATSALDSVSEELIQDALFKLMENKTVIVVAHRLSTVQRLDRILVIEDGEIKEDGSHQELLRKGGLYKNFWKKQTERFE